MTGRYTRLMLVVALAVLGCAKPDWIQDTLVTVDVTGVWEGEGIRAPSGVLAVRLDLQQHGPKVSGNVRLTGYAAQSGGSAAGPVEGSVAGDTFKFHQTNGRLSGEMTVVGDEMKGSAELSVVYQVSLRRVASASPRP